MAEVESNLRSEPRVLRPGELAHLAGRLSATRLDLDLAATRAPSAERLPPRPGFFLHSTVGEALRRVACEAPHGCGSRCRFPEACAVGRTLEPRPRDPAGPRRGRDDAPVRLVVQAPWSWEPGTGPTRAALVLLSPWPEDLAAYQAALASGQIRGAARRFGREISIVAPPPVLGPLPSPPPTSGRWALRLSLLSPLMLRARGQVLRQFEPLAFLKRAAWRVSRWAYDLEGLSWPQIWPGIEAEAGALVVHEQRIESVRDSRWSARQRQRVPRSGLLGEVELTGVGPQTRTLLRLAERCGVGAGASEGMGWIEVGDVRSEEGT